MKLAGPENASPGVSSRLFYANNLVTGRPVTVLNRGLPVIRDRVLCAAEGQGRFIARKPLARTT